MIYQVQKSGRGWVSATPLPPSSLPPWRGGERIRGSEVKKMCCIPDDRPEYQPQEEVIETYRGCDILECVYGYVFYATVLPNGNSTGAKTIEEVREVIDAYHRGEPWIAIGPEPL